MARIPSTTAPEGSPIPERHPMAPVAGSKIPSHFGHCFGCGELHPTGLHLVAYAGAGLDITAEITGQVNRKVYTSAIGRLNSEDGEIAVRAAALYIVVPMDHFMNNAPQEYLA